MENFVIALQCRFEAVQPSLSALELQISLLLIKMWVFCIQMKRVSILIFALLFFSMAPRAQQPGLAFHHLAEADGLADNVVNCFLKDSRGILWIGTYNGMSRYDGANFYNYKKRRNYNSLVNEVVHKLCEDKKGNIWGVTNGGVFCYMPQSDSFASYPLKIFNREVSCYNILCDRAGTIWVSGASSVYRYNPAADSFEEKIKLSAVYDSMAFYSIHKNGLKEDPSATGFWMATASAGLMYYDYAKEQLVNYKTEHLNPLFRKRKISALSASLAGHCWFFDNDTKDIVHFNPGRKEEIKKINIKNTLPNANGGTIYEDSKERIWFCSWTYELLLIDQQNNNKAYRLLHSNENKQSVAGHFFWDVLEDEDKNIWLGTVAGISICNPEKPIYRRYELPAVVPELRNTSIQLAEENPTDGTIWIITESSLLIQYNTVNQQRLVYNLHDAVPGPGGSKPGYCTGIKFFKGSVVLPTLTGAWQVKPGNKRLVPFQLLPKGYEGFICTNMAMNGDSVLYYTNGTEILYWNYLKGFAQKTGLEINKTPLAAGSRIKAMEFTPAQQLWILLTNNAIAYLDEQKQIIAVDILKGSDPRGPMMRIDQDKMGKVWIANRGAGMFTYNPADKKTELLDESNGLAGNRIHQLLTDADGHIWSVHYNKVSVYLPAAGKFYNITVPYSESNLDYQNHMCRLANGHILASINNDLVEFYPERLVNVPANPAPQISQVVVSGKNISIFKGTKIILKPGENNIRFRFGSFINKEIFPYDVEYKLDGATKEWAIAGDNPEVLYNNLGPGNYVFRVRVRGKNNGWLSDEASLPFTIGTPFYKTWWFIALVTLLVAGLIYTLYRFRLNKHRQVLELEGKAQLLEKEKTMVMYDNLKQQLNPHFLFNSLTSLSGLIETNQQMAGDFLEQMSGIYRYILKNNETETVLLKDELDFVQLYINLQQTRFKKGLLVNINVKEEYRHYKIAPVTLQNLIENAIKHNIIDADAPLVIDIFTDDGYLHVRNNLQRKNMVETSNKKGLSQFETLYRFLSTRPVVIEETSEHFIIKIPLI
ncbi:MAG: histidine kinase [Ferruginibacter sp.]|nr:histidine kinase [Ferruginibacter sp.]